MRGLYRVPEAAPIPARKWIKSGKRLQKSRRIKSLLEGVARDEN